MSEPKRQRKTLAVIDVGSNTVHMMIAQLDLKTGAFEIIGKKKEYVRLGEYSHRGNTLTRDAMDRAIETLRMFKVVANFHRAEIHAVATSAVRDASNRQDFLKMVWQATGIRIHVVSGREEARLIYLGVLRALPVYQKKILLIDIGGGSTELLVGERGKVLYSTSLKLGALRLTRAYFSRGAVTRWSVQQGRSVFAAALEPVRKALEKQHYQKVVGSSGTIAALAKMSLLLEPEDAKKGINRSVLTRKKLAGLVERITAMSQRKKGFSIPGIDRQRADLILGGSLILEQLFKELGLKKMVVSSYAIREGLLEDSLNKRYGMEP